jgi:type I restriction enzyme S subunit
MSSEWRTEKLGDLTFNFDTRRKPVKEVDRKSGPYPYYGASGIVDYVDGYLFDGEYLLVAEDGENLRTRQTPVAFIGKGRFWVNNHAHIVTGNERARTRYLLYALLGTDISAYLTGAVMPKLTQGNLNRIEVPCPPTEAQDAIVGILGALDDRITLLHETNATLEAIAQALFKSWFVDFDPVRAKQEGRAPEGMDEATAALFPDGFEESELGLVPRGWRVGSIDDLCEVITNGGTPSRSNKSFWDFGSIPWFKTGDFSDGFLLTPSERITDDALKSSSAKLLPENAVLMAIYAAPTVGRLGVLTEPATFNQACTGMVAKLAIGPWFLYWTLYFGREWFNSRANGAAQQNISKAIVASYRSIVPPEQVLAAFNEVASALHFKVRAGSETAQTLATLRDTLLPRLISGQLRLPEAEAMRDAVAT